jgi:hypothetical protein
MGPLVTGWITLDRKGKPSRISFISSGVKERILERLAAQRRPLTFYFFGWKKDSEGQFKYNKHKYKKKVGYQTSGRFFSF